jgi:hypothetical protein
MDDLRRDQAAAEINAIKLAFGSLSFVPDKVQLH